MMGRLETQENLFYRFRIEDYVPQNHLLRRIGWLLDFDAIRAELAALYSHTGRPSVDPELKTNMHQQQEAMADKDTKSFHEFDYEFHKLLGQAAGKAFAFDIIAGNKAQVDRLCMLSLTSEEAMRTLYADHDALLEAPFFQRRGNRRKSIENAS